MSLNKRTYTDNVTLITAENLNDIQDAVIALENEIASGGGGVPTNVRQAMLTLFESAAYAETGLTDEIAIVESWATAVTSLTLSASTLSVVQPSTGTLTATVVPSTASVTWSSSDETIATVNGGVVTGVSNGSCVITASAGDKSATCTVTVSGFAELVSISAVYTQSGTVYDTDSLDDLKDDLVVTATYSDSSTETITTYTLSGTLTVGTSTITVSYGGKTDTFNVAVSAEPADPIHTSPLTLINASGTTGSWDAATGTGYVQSNGANAWPALLLNGLVYKFSEINDKTLRFQCDLTISGVTSGTTGRGAYIASGLYTNANPTANNNTYRKAAYLLYEKLDNGTFSISEEVELSTMFTGSGLDNYYLGLTIFSNASGVVRVDVSNIVAEVY